MQDKVYCFHLLTGRQKRTLLYAFCSVPAVAAVWLMNPEWPFWAGYITWALVCTAVLVIQYAAPVPVRCPRCGRARLRPAPQTPEEQRNPHTGIMLGCRSCGTAFRTDAYIPWPGKSIRRRPGSPAERNEQAAHEQAGPASSGEESRPDRFS